MKRSAEVDRVCICPTTELLTVSECRGRVVWDVPTAEVRVGDTLCAWLSDASAYMPVTGWSDRTLELSRASRGVLADVVHRTFEVTGAPWWIDYADRSADLAGHVFILARTESE